MRPAPAARPEPRTGRDDDVQGRSQGRVPTSRLYDALRAFPTPASPEMPEPASRATIFRPEPAAEWPSPTRLVSHHTPENDGSVRAAISTDKSAAWGRWPVRRVGSNEVDDLDHATGIIDHGRVPMGERATE